MKDIAPKPVPSLPAPDMALKLVAESFTLKVDDLLGRRRDKETAMARQVAMYVLKQQGGQSLSDIGRLVGGRGASTVSHACDKVNRDIEASPVLRRQIDGIRQKLASF